MELNNQSNRLSKYEPIDKELKRAEKKHPHYPADMFEQFTILHEEVGEVSKAILHFYREDGSIDDVRNELIQSAAMCMRMLKAIDGKQ